LYVALTALHVGICGRALSWSPYGRGAAGVYIAGACGGGPRNTSAMGRECDRVGMTFGVADCVSHLVLLSECLPGANAWLSAVFTVGAAVGVSLGPGRESSPRAEATPLLTTS